MGISITPKDNGLVSDGAIVVSATSVTVPTPTSAGHALAWGDDATVAALDATTGDFTGNVTLETAFAALQLDATTQGYIRFQGGDGITRAELTYNAGTGLFQLSRRDAAGTFQNAAFVYNVGTDAFAFQSASVTVPTPTASGQAVKVVAWDDTTGRYAVQGPNGVLEQGDTGWRDVSADLTNGFAGTLLIRRVGNMVSVRVSFDASAKTNDSFYTLPTGFGFDAGGATVANSGNDGYWALNNSTANTDVSEWFSPGGAAGASLKTSSVLVVNYGEATYATDDAWLSSLPGTAV
jgi:hypothetical protein